MLDKDVEAEGATNMCGDNLIVCGALAEGLVVFIFIQELSMGVLQLEFELRRGLCCALQQSSRAAVLD